MVVSNIIFNNVADNTGVVIFSFDNISLDEPFKHNLYHIKY